MSTYGEDDGGSFFGGLGGLGGLNNFLTNPLLLASLQMISNNTPRVGQPVDTLHGVPQLLFTAATKKKEDDDKNKAKKDLEALFGQLNSPNQINEPPKPISSPAQDSPPVSRSDGPSVPGFGAPSENAGVEALPSKTYGNTAANAMDFNAPAPATSSAPQPEQPSSPNQRVASQQAPAAAAPKLNWLNLPESVQRGLGITPPEQKAEQPQQAPADLEERIAQSAQRLTEQQPPTQTQRAVDAYTANRAPQRDQGQMQPMAAAQGAPAQKAEPLVPAQAQAAPQSVTDRAATAYAQNQAQPNPAQNQPQPVTDRAAATYAQNQAQSARPPMAAPATPLAQRVDPKLLARVYSNADPATKAQIMKQLNPEYTFHTAPDGTVIRMNPRTGTAEPVYQGGLKPTFGKIGSDPFSGDKMGWIDPGKRTVEEYKPSGEAANSGAEAVSAKIQALREKGASQDDIIDAAVPTHMREYVRGMLRGDADPAKLGRLQGQTKLTLLALAHEIDPNFQEGQIALRQSFAKNMASSSPNSWGTQVRSAGTVVKHLNAGLDNLDVIERGADGVPGGAYGEVGLLNRARSVANANATDKAYNKAKGAYSVDSDAVSGEVVRLLTGGQGSEKDRQEWKDKFDYTKNSISSVRGAWNEAYNIMYGRLEKIAEQKDNAYGGQTDPLDLLGKGAREAEARLRKQGAAPGTQGAPRITSEKEYNDLKPGTRYTDPDGNLRTKQ